MVGAQPATPLGLRAMEVDALIADPTFAHIHDMPDKVWPRSVEAQLQSGVAGDFWLIDDARLDTPAERIDRGTPRHRLRARTNERGPESHV